MPLPRPALAGATALVFFAWTVSPALAAVPDGDLNEDERLDAADVLLMQRMLAGEIAEDLAHGDVAPLGSAPDGALEGGDLVVLLRGVAEPDLDGDGLESAEELAGGASPFAADTDGDGLLDPLELFLGTDPALTDSDGDGIPDPQEDSDEDGFVNASDADPGSGVIYRHADQLGGTVLVTRADGALLERVVYKPFGEVVPSTSGGSTDAPPFGFTGQRYEAAIGIYDYGARRYDPALGRFLQPDSVVPDPFDPQSFNPYSYVLNNPANLIDPTGNFPDIFGGIAGAARAVGGFVDEYFLSPVGSFGSGFGSSLSYGLGGGGAPSGSGFGYGLGQGLGAYLGLSASIAVNSSAAPLRLAGSVVGTLPFVGDFLSRPLSSAGNAIGSYGGRVGLRATEGLSLNNRAATHLLNLTVGAPQTAIGLAYAGTSLILGTPLALFPGISVPRPGLGSPAREASTSNRFLSITGGLQDIDFIGPAVSLGAVVSFRSNTAGLQAYNHGLSIGRHESGHVEESALFGPLYLPFVLSSYAAQMSRGAPGGFLANTAADLDASRRGRRQN